MYDIAGLNFEDTKYEELITTLINGTCVFLGAGVSKLGGYRLWNELAESMIGDYWNRRNEILDSETKFNFSVRTYLLSCNSPIEVMDYLFSLNQTLFFEILGKNFNGVNEKSEVYNKFNFLVKRVGSFFVQTNIDLGFQTNLNIGGDDVDINPEFSNTPKKLNYLHGKLGIKESLVFTRRQYDHNYLDEASATMQFLVPIFKRYNVIFFGYSLRDFEILQAISKARINNQFSRTHYLFEPVYGYKLTEFEVKKTNIKNNFGIEIIPYNIEKTGYDLLLEVLDKVDVAISRKERVKEAVTPPVTGDETSYAK